jgi:hypothetical protein
MQSAVLPSPPSRDSSVHVARNERDQGQPGLRPFPHASTIECWRESMASDQWKPMTVIGSVCRGHFIRTRVRMEVANDTVINNPAAPRKITLEKGAIGYCYAGSGVIHVGFTRDFSMRELSSPSSYPFVATFTWQDITKLEILENQS